MTALGVVVIAPTIVRYTMKHLVNGVSTQQNIIDLSIEPMPGTSRAEAIGEVNGVVNHWWQQRLITGGLNNITFLGSHWIDLDSPDGGTGDIGPHAGDATTGSVAATCFPPNVSFLVHKNSTARRGLKQGRLYWGPVTEGEADNTGLLIAANRNAVTAKFEAFRADAAAFGSLGVDSANWLTVHVTKPDKTDPSTWTWSSSTIDSVVCDDRVATQRRRLERARG